MDWLVKLFQIDDCSAEAVTAVATCILAILAIATLVVVLLVSLRQLSRLRKDSHKQLMISLLEKWESQNMVESRVALGKIIRMVGSPSKNISDEKQILKEASKLKEELYKLDEKGDKEYFEIIRIADYMETVGYIMTSRQDKRVAKDLFGDAITTYYQRFQLWIEEERKKTPRIYEYFTKLYEFCKK